MSKNDSKETKEFIEKIEGSGLSVISDTEIDHPQYRDSDNGKATVESVRTSYLEDHRIKRKLKIAFFTIIMIMYVLVVLGSILVMVLIPIYCENFIVRLAAIISALTSLIVAMLKIPTIIAVSLFPTNEDETFVKIASRQFSHDEVVLRENNKKNSNKGID